MGAYLYLIAGILLVVAAVLSRAGPKNSFRARDVTGNTMVGDVTGNVTQTNSPPPESKPDRIAWGIAVVGVLVAVAQLAHDMLAK